MDTDATVRLVLHFPEFGTFHLKPLTPAAALEIVLAARAANVRIERLPDLVTERS